MGFISEIFGYVLNFLYNLINNYGVAIIIFSVLLRLLLLPITIKQQKTMKKSAKLQEKMKEIQEKYKGNPEKLNQETIELYKNEKMNPFSGCFTAILQLLIILAVFWLVSQPLTYMKKAYNSEDTKIVMEEYKKELEESGTRRNYPEIQIISKIEEDYQKIVRRLNGEEITEEQIEEVKDNIENQENSEETQNVEENSQNENEQKEVKKKIEDYTEEELKSRKEVLEKLRINMSFLGLDLSKVPTENLGDWRVYVIPVLYVITSFISIKITTITQKKANEKKKETEPIVINEDGKKEEAKDDMMDSMNQMNNSMLYMLPIMSISIAVIAPLGLALYWFVSNILIIVERLVLNKFAVNKEEDENE